MYGWLFLRLPGPTSVRVLLSVALLVLVVVACFGWIFPTFADALLDPGA